MDELVLKLALFFFEKWKKEKIDEGYHQPELCPKFEKNYEKEDDIKNGDLIHCSKCLSELDDFNNVSPHVKERYSNLAKEVIDYLSKNSFDVIYKR